MYDTIGIVSPYGALIPPLSKRRIVGLDEATGEVLESGTFENLYVRPNGDGSVYIEVGGPPGAKAFLRDNGVLGCASRTTP